MQGGKDGEEVNKVVLDRDDQSPCPAPCCPLIPLHVQYIHTSCGLVFPGTIS